MEQLNGLDAFFAHGESKTTPMHIGVLLVYVPPTQQHSDFRYREILQLLRGALPSSAIFRRRLVSVPAGLDHPYWVEDADFVLENHLHQCRLRQDASPEDLQTLLAELHAQAMDFSRPLWEAHIIEGLGQLAAYPAHSFGLYLKVHHAAMDGVSGTAILSALHGVEAGQTPTLSAADHWRGEALPSKAALLRQAYWNAWRRPLRLLNKSRRLLPDLRRQQQSSPAHDHRPRPSWQRSPFSRAVDGQRQLLALHFDLGELRRIRRLFPETTLNHVILTLISGALRRYLIALNQLPDNPLGCLVPVNLRGGGQRGGSRDAGNAIGMLVACLRSDIEDPLQRLQAVRDAASSARKFSEGVGRHRFSELLRELPSGAERASLRVLSVLSRLPGGLPLPACTVVSNIPGPPLDLYLNRAKLVGLQGMGMLTDGCGLFHVAMSYQDKLCLSVLSCPRTLSRPALYRQSLQQSFDELSAAAQRQHEQRQPLARKTQQQT